MRMPLRWMMGTAIVGVVASVAMFGLQVAGEGAADGATNESEEWRQVEDWPIVPRWMKWESGAGVAVDAQGIVHYLSRDAGSITKWDPQTGRFLGHWGTFTSHSTSPTVGVVFGAAAKGGHSLKFNADGTLWVVERDRHTVRKFSADGTKVLLSLGTEDQFGETPTLFNGPSGIEVLPNGNLVVSDGYWNSRLVWFDANGKFIRAVGRWGNGPLEFGGVHGVALDATRNRLIVSNECPGNLHARDPGLIQPGQIAAHRNTPLCDEVGKMEGRIPVFDLEGNHVKDWAMGGPGHSWNTVAFRDRIYTSQGEYVAIRDPESGAIVGKIADATNGHNIAFDRQGDNLYVASIAPRGSQANAKWAPLRKFTRTRRSAQ